MLTRRHGPIISAPFLNTPRGAWIFVLAFVVFTVGIVGVKRQRNKNEYTRTLDGISIEKFTGGYGDSQLELEVSIPGNPNKKTMRPHYLTHRTKADRDVVITAIRLYIDGGNAKSDEDRKACERFIELLTEYAVTHTRQLGNRDW
jgi:hypothetical protein